MRFFPDGRIVSGLGQTTLDEHRVVGQRNFGGDDWQICVDGVPVSARGCTPIAAGGGRWKGYLAGNGIFGPDSEFDTRFAIRDGQTGIEPAGRVGTLGFCGSDGYGLLLDHPSRVEWFTRDACTDGGVYIHDQAHVLAQNAFTKELMVRGFPKPALLPGPIGWPSAVQLRGVWWWLYVNGDFCYFHPEHEPVGHIIGERNHGFYPHVLKLTEDTALVGWAHDSGDTDIR